MKKPIVLFSLVAIPLLSFGQESKGFVATYFGEIVLTIALFVALIALLLLLLTVQAVKAFKETTAVKQEASETWLNRWWATINSFKPPEQETGMMTSHEYDGIRELDNSLPPWWKWMFYLTIVFGVFYMAHYHVLGTGSMQDEEYLQEVAVAKKEVAAYKAAMLAQATPEEVPVTGPDAIAAGKKTYQKFCSTCHGSKGEGGIGPNFVDQYWMHGGSMADIIATIEEGVPTKGMISWKNQLSGAEIKQVAAFIYDLEGNAASGQKAPQGELYERITEE